MRINKLHLAWFVVSFCLGITVFELMRWVEHKFDVSPARIAPNATVRDFDDEQAIYDTILADKFSERRPIVMLESKFSRFSVDGQNEELQKLESLIQKDGLEKTTLEDFFNQNREVAHMLRRSFTGYVSVTREEVQSIFDTYGMKGWSEVRTRFPNSDGVLSFSRIGFNKEHTQAFVCVGWANDVTNGSGGYLLLQKTANGWVMKTVGEVWVS